MKSHPVALALIPKVTHPFSQVPTVSPALWQLPVSLLHKGLIGYIEPGEPQDGSSKDNPLSHHQSSSWLSLPWQGFPVHALLITLVSLAWEEQMNLLWYQIRPVQVSWLHLVTPFGGAHIHKPGCAHGLGAPQCMWGRRHSSQTGGLGHAMSIQTSAKTSCPALVHQSAAVFRCSPSPWAGDGGCSAGKGLEIALWSHRMIL